jgi:DNA polymerase-3 subunit gamma/tau
MVARAGSLATINCKPRQARKGATVAVGSGAEGKLVRAATTLLPYDMGTCRGLDSMSYQVLARKWRPKNFGQMVGQKHVLRVLINGLNQGRLHHAYLFSGTRGVGKTTLARILAKCFNCDEGVGASPCGVCDACNEIDEGRFVDLLEVDAASRTKVEDTRELLENVQYAPTRGRYKVYLIDEVHMLSGHSFNALLKTLEEPPPHVKFLLATTDPQKLPVTVLSRCLQFNLKRLTSQMISGYLRNILTHERITADDSALDMVANAADGSMRDALSLLDQAIAYGNGRVRETDVNEMLGTVPRELFQNLVFGLAKRDAQRVMDTVSSLAEQSVNFSDALSDLLSLFHQAAIVQTLPSAVVHMANDYELVSMLATAASPEDVQLFYQIALTCRRDLSLAPEPRIGFEMALLRMLTFQPLRLSGDAKPVLRSPPNKDSVMVSDSHQGESPQDRGPEISLAPQPESVKRLPGSNLASHLIPVDWPELVKKLKVKGVAYALASNCSLKTYQNGDICLGLEARHAEIRTQNAELRLQQALSEFFAKEVKLRIEISEHTSETPAQLQDRALAQKQQAAEQAIQRDSFVQDLKDQFGAKIIPGSIKPVSSHEG